MIFRLILLFSLLVTPASARLPWQPFVGGVTTVTSIWNSADKSANITLTINATVATSTSSTTGSVRSVNFQSTGKYYWTVTAPSVLAGGSVVGFGDQTAPLGSILGSTATGWSINGGASGGFAFNSNTGVNTGLGTFVAGDTIDIATSLDDQLCWYRVNGGNWNNSGAANPATLVGGFVCNRFANLYAMANFRDNASASTINYTSGTPPSGYTAGIPSGGVAYAPGHTWDPVTNTSVSTQLSGGRLTAKSPAAGSVYRLFWGATGASSGKWYWELTATAVTTGFVGAGIANASQANNNYLGSSNNGIGWEIDGSVYRNGSSVSTVASYTNGATLSIAWDAGNQLIWFRNGAGNWNNNALADPALGIAGLGIDVSAITGTKFPAINTNANSHIFTANFGGSSFAQSVPTGFTGGP